MLSICGRYFHIFAKQHFTGVVIAQILYKFIFIPIIEIDAFSIGADP